MISITRVLEIRDRDETAIQLLDIVQAKQYARPSRPEAYVKWKSNMHRIHRTSRSRESMTISRKDDSSLSYSHGLVVIARNASGQTVTRTTSYRDLIGATHTAYCVPKLKLDAVRIEVHYKVLLQGIAGIIWLW